MADTLGSLVDKLITVDMKLWNNQELLHDVQRMSGGEEFEAKYTDPTNLRTLYDMLMKIVNLNLQRNNLVDEIDETLYQAILVSMHATIALAEHCDPKEVTAEIRAKFMQPKHKTAEVKV
jgi:hypothetical protein